MSESSRPLPERFGPYRVEALVGAGGMGVVYRALDVALQRQVALKTLLPALAADPEFVARFKREAQSAAALNHPNITQIYSIGDEGGIPFFAMELIHGRSLETLIKDGGAADPAEASAWMLQAARGLQHAARRLLIHRDVKPSNLMLGDDGVVKITDFGLAKAARSGTQLTAAGEVLGSPGYISPEQAQGAPLDARSDIYSLGATFYHLATGRLPFEAPTPVAMIVRHLNDPLKSPRAVNPALPYPVAAMIQKMMAKRPGERFQDYEALIREIERVLPLLASGGRAPQPAAAPPERAWAGMTGAEARPRPRAAAAATAPAAAPARRGGVPILPLFLAVALGGLIVAGVVTRQRPAGPGGAADARAALSGPRRAAPLVGEGTFVEGESQGAAPARDAGGRGFSSDERARERFRGRSRANLAFAANDHEVLPDGRLRVFGRVTNGGGGVASQSRVRVQVLREDGQIAARGEAALFPALLPPGASAEFDLPIDYTGPVGTIKAELIWVE